MAMYREVIENGVKRLEEVPAGHFEKYKPPVGFVPPEPAAVKLEFRLAALEAKTAVR